MCEVISPGRICNIGVLCFAWLLGAGIGWLELPLVGQDSSTMQQTMRIGDRLSDAQVVQFASLALKGMDTEFPNKPSNVMVGPESVQAPREMHPAFFGCFDWHSSVHGHWMLVHLIREYPDCSQAQLIREKLNDHLTKEKLLAEAEHFALEHNKSFERMYGWAWYLRLVAECHAWTDDVDAQRWRENLRPLEELLVQRVADYLPKLSFPIRTGVHPNTAFALGQIWDYAEIVGNEELLGLISRRSREYYFDDREYPLHYEPSGQDFFSAGLNEADLMRRVLAADEFSDWFASFLPNLGARNSNASGLEPAEVSDVTDGKIVHLAGLDLSRAWCLHGILSALPQDHPQRKYLQQAAQANAAVGLKYVFSGSYEGEHWLATFAVYALDRVGIDK